MRASLPDDKVALVAIAAVAALCYLLVVYLVGLLIEVAAGGPSDFSGLYSLVVLPLCAVAYRCWAPEKTGTPPSLVVSAVLAVVVGLAACAVGALVGDVRTASPTVLTIVCIGVAAPVAEELLFRGVILGRLEGKMGPLPALAVSSVLFAVAHIGSGGAVAALASGVAGLMFGGVYLKTRSATWAIVAHAVSNLATFALASFLG